MTWSGPTDDDDVFERLCCLLVLNLVSSTLSCIRQPRPRLIFVLAETKISPKQYTPRVYCFRGIFRTENTSGVFFVPKWVWKNRLFFPDASWLSINFSLPPPFILPDQHPHKDDQLALALNHLFQPFWGSDVSGCPSDAGRKWKSYSPMTAKSCHTLAQTEEGGEAPKHAPQTWIHDQTRWLCPMKIEIISMQHVQKSSAFP